MPESTVGASSPDPSPSSQRRASLSDVLEQRPSTPRTRSKFSWAGLKQRVMSAAVGGSAADAEDWKLDELPASFYDLHAEDAKGAPVSMQTFENQVCLVVNVASF